MTKLFFIALFATVSVGLFRKGPVSSQPKPATAYIVDTLASGLVVPWEIIFLPGNTLLFTERSGKVRICRNHQLLAKPALVAADVNTNRKMGLLGMCIHPQFNQNQYLYLSYNYKDANSSKLKIIRYRFVNDSLMEPYTILENINASPNHTGCRLKFGPDKKLYITTGDADRPILAQDLKSLNGKILRVNDDGSIPSDNPFFDNDTARKEIWTYGHRNIQGIDFQPGTNQLYASEHGPTGGDEVNGIIKGSNYGWPLAHHQDNREGMAPPLLEYSPSIGPSQLLFYTGNAFPALKGKLLLACLRGEKIMQLQVDKNKLIEEENLLFHTYGRIRALTEGPDGCIYFSTSENDPPEGRSTAGFDLLLCMRPPGSSNPGQPEAGVKRTVIAKTVAHKTPSVLYMELCAGCHGRNLEGSERAKNLLIGKWPYGDARPAIIKNIRNGIIEKGMPAWEGSLTDKEINAIADVMLKKRRPGKGRGVN